MVSQLNQTEPIEPHPLVVAIVVAESGTVGEGEGDEDEMWFFGVAPRENAIFRSHSTPLTFSHLITFTPSFSLCSSLGHRSSLVPVTSPTLSKAALFPYDHAELRALVRELKRLTLNAPIVIVPLSELVSLQSEPSLLCIVVHTTFFDAAIRSLPSPPYALIVYNDDELALVDLVVQPRKRKRKRR